MKFYGFGRRTETLVNFEAKLTDDSVAIKPKRFGKVEFSTIEHFGFGLCMRNRKTRSRKVAEAKNYRRRKIPKPKSQSRKVTEANNNRSRKIPKPKSQSQKVTEAKKYRSRKIPKPKIP